MVFAKVLYFKFVHIGNANMLTNDENIETNKLQNRSLKTKLVQSVSTLFLNFSFSCLT